MTALSDRERFCAQVYTAPLLKADAVVVLCGEDATARLTTGCELVRAECASTLVLSGGRHNPPSIQNAASLAPEALALGIAPDRIIIEDGSQHTGEQAANVIALAVANGWKRLLLVASAYHCPRVMLTFIHAASQAGLGEKLHLIAVPSVGHWHEAIPHTRLQRRDALAQEFSKIDQYHAGGHCATYAMGLRYLILTEGK